MTQLKGSKHVVFWLVLVAVVTLAALSYVQSIRRSNGARRSLYVVGEAQRGAKLFYGNKQCSICHSVNGSGGRLAPELSGRPPETPAMGWLTAKLWNHGPGMWRQLRRQNTPLPELNEQEMADMLAFLFQASMADPPGDARNGRAVFNDKGCIRCHSVGDTGGKAAPELSNIAAGKSPDAWITAMLNHAGQMVGPITKTLGQWPQFKGHEMNDLISYVGLGKDSKKQKETAASPDKGWALFKGNCIQCHSVRGQGGDFGPRLGPERELPLSTARFASLMWNHAPDMLQKAQKDQIAPPVLQGTDMADLLAFLASVRYSEPIGSPQIGERVFAQRGCANCHGAKAEGTDAGPPLRANKEVFTAVSFTTALWHHGPKMIDRAEQLGMQWPELEPTDIGDLVSFLNAQEALR